MKHYFSEFQADVIYDICHNIAKVEKHNIEDNGKKVKKDILIMRKGATRSFPNQPVILPGSMGTSSYLLLGTEKAMELSFGSTGHGAGRVKSRSQARKTISPEAVKKEMKDKGIELETRDFRGVVEEASEVYKDIDEVIQGKEFETLTDIQKEQVITEFQTRWSDPDSEIVKRMNSFSEKSPEILKLILES